MPIPSRPDLCVIGGGTAGHALALAAGALGLRCMVIDPRERLGTGQAADLAEAMLFAAARGQAAGAPPDMAGLRARIGLGVNRAARDHAAARLASAGVAVITGTPCFSDPRTVVVNGREIRARRFVLATGGTEVAPPAWARREPPLLRPRDILAGPAPLPEAVTILATVPRGLEWAQALNRLGVRVTLHMTATAAGAFDPGLVRQLGALLEGEGVRCRFVAESDRPPGGEEGARLMVLTPPRPVTTGLGLARAGVALVGDAPLVDRALRTTNHRVLALGDVLGRPSPGGAVVPAQVGTVLRGLVLRWPVRDGSAMAPLLLDTRPALAQVGAPGDALGHVARFSLGETMLGRAGAEGRIVVWTTPRGVVRGAAVLGPTAADAIVPWTMAVRGRMRLAAMAGLPVPALAGAEAGRRAALAATAAGLRRPWIRRLVRWLQRLP